MSGAHRDHAAEGDALGKALYDGAMTVLARAARLETHTVTLRPRGSDDGGEDARASIVVPFFERRARGASAELPVVLVHGFSADKESWLMLTPWMRRARALVIPDLPGFGGASAIPKSSASPMAQAGAVLALLDHLGIARAHVVGNSMGGGIALRMADDHPARVASISLLGSVGPTPVKSEVFRAFDAGQNPLLPADDDAFADLVRLVMARPVPVPPAVRRYLGRRQFARRDAYAALFDGWNAPTPGEGVPTDLARIRTPALVLHGALDRVIDPATGRALAEGLPDARLVILPQTGHAPQVEAPRAVARHLDAFFAEVESRSR